VGVNGSSGWREVRVVPIESTSAPELWMLDETIPAL
jgi:hypothetical protein